MAEQADALEGRDPKRIVEEGYDHIAEAYLAWGQEDPRAVERHRYTAALLDGLPLGARVLDLGCGAGVPTTAALAARFRVAGADISARQIALARRNVPGAEFIRADMAQLDLPPASLDGVAAFYSLIHLPRGELAGLLGRVATWLRPGGLFVAAFGTSAEEAGYEDDFLGAPMYWSGYDPATSCRLVEEAGLEIVSAREETAEEFGRPVSFLWVVARRGRD